MGRFGQILGGDRRKTRRREFGLDHDNIIVRRGHQRYRIATKKFADNLSRHLQDAALPVAPDAEQTSPGWSQCPQGLTESGLLIGVKRHAELADPWVIRPLR